MLPKTFRFPLLAQAALLTTSPAIHTRELAVEYDLKAIELSLRPSWFTGPHNASRPNLLSPARTKVCYVKSHDDGESDDSPYILQAIHACNPGGHVVFPKGTTYVIGTALNLIFLSHIDIGKE